MNGNTALHCSVSRGHLLLCSKLIEFDSDSSIYSLDAGSMELFGKKIRVKNSEHANDLGLGMVHQHFKLINNR